MSTRRQTVCVERLGDLPLYADLWLKNPEYSLPLVIVLHGFRTHKDWGFFPELGFQLARSGAHCLVLNFSHNGYSWEGVGETTVRHEFDAELFATNTVRQERKDVRDLMHAIKTGWLQQVGVQWDGRIYIVGHSRGSGIALLTAEEFSDVKALCLWSAIKSFDRTTTRQKQLWRQSGRLVVESGSSGPSFSMDIEYLNDLEQHQQEYALTRSISTCNIPVELLVGAQDMVSPAAESTELLSFYSGPHSALHVLARCGHSLNCTEPFKTASECLREAILITQRSFALEPPLLHFE